MIFAIFIDFTVVSKRAIYHYELVFFSEKKSEENEEEDSFSSNLEAHNLQNEKKKSYSDFFKNLIQYLLSALRDF